MTYTVKSTSQFRRDYKLAMKQGRNIALLDNVIKLLAAGVQLPDEYHDHPLQGNWRGHRECHILPDWLLVYKVDDNVLVLTLTRTGTHSALFGL